MVTTLAAPSISPLRMVRLRDGFPFAVRVFGAVWVGWAVLGLLATVVSPGGDPIGAPGLDAAPLSDGWHNLWDSGQRADAYWYQRIAIDGYHPDDGSAAFFPLYPLLTHLTFVLLHLPPQFAGFLAAQGCFLASLAVLYALTSREFGVPEARNATIYLAIFPTAFFLLAPYAESLFLLLALLAFWFARSGLWGRAALFAGAAALTRSAGLMLGLAFAVEAIVRWRRDRQPPLRGLAAAAAPLPAYLLLASYWAKTAGDPAAPLTAQQGWGRESTFPLTTLYHAVEQAVELHGYWMIDLLVVAVAAVSIVAGTRLIPLCYTVFALACLVLPLCAPWPPRPLMSVPRFVAVIFPVFWVIALATARFRLPHTLVAGVFAGGYALLGLLFARGYGIF
jgi:hypothetical protein